jgi:mRNA interferase MazF
MGKFIKGDVVVLPFPFSDLSNSKKRPPLVISENIGDDIILCQITSQFTHDLYAIPINDFSFEVGRLPVESNIRPNRIFTADNNLILKKAGHLKKDVYSKVIEAIIGIIE